MELKYIMLTNGQSVFGDSNWHITIRITNKDKGLIKYVASLDGMKVKDWVKNTLIGAASREVNDNGTMTETVDNLSPGIAFVNGIK
jgi:uncharacterized protein (DUF1778 family)